MTRKLVGLALVIVEPADTAEDVTAAVKRAAAEVTPGRTVGVLWEVPQQWVPQRPVEAWATRAFLGRPGERGEIRREEPNFFGNVVVRGYSAADPLVPVCTFQLLLFTSVGAPARLRVREPDTPIDLARLDTRAFAFTRDYANNVWHLPASSIERRIRDRLTRLLCWPDEGVVLVRGSSVSRPARPKKSLGDLVGVPEKQAYSWPATVQDQSPLPGL